MRFKLLENIIADITKMGVFHYIYMNPTSADLNSKEDSKDNRAILDSEGNMYMEAAWDKDGSGDIRSELIHNNILDVLHEQGILQEITAPDWYNNQELFDYAVFIQRNGRTKNFYIAESYDDEMLDSKTRDKINIIFGKAQKKNPSCTFTANFIYNINFKNLYI